MFLDRLLKNDEGTIDYDQHKVSAQYIEQLGVSENGNLPSE